MSYEKKLASQPIWGGHPQPIVYHGLMELKFCQGRGCYTYPTS